MRETAGREGRWIFCLRKAGGMKVIGDVEAVNLRTGERFRRVAGDGESRLVSESELIKEKEKENSGYVVEH
ncbi:MAG TPA: hypothetical protein VJQ59_16765 [Candidatus Sulfotelmatobacter sp.]|nr:hypothetical protein [Candidatus Sulfotelmatobacter sp.]